MNTIEQDVRQNTEKEDVIELLVKLLYQQNMREQAQDFKEIFQYVAGVQLQLGVMAKELQGVREELKELQQYQPKEATKECVDEVLHLQKKTHNVSERFSSMKDRLIKTATQAINTFKEKGKAAMCKVLQKGIDAEKSVLAECRAKLVDVMTDCGKTADRIDGIGNEIKQAGRSISNVGRLLAGKEAKEMSREKPGVGITRALNKPVRKMIADLGKNVDRIDKASEKLDKMSDRLRFEKEQEKETRPSMKEKLSEMQTMVDEQKSEASRDREKAAEKEKVGESR